MNSESISLLSCFNWYLVTTIWRTGKDKVTSLSFIMYLLMSFAIMSAYLFVSKFGWSWFRARKLTTIFLLRVAMNSSTVLINEVSINFFDNLWTNWISSFMRLILWFWILIIKSQIYSSSILFISSIPEFCWIYN